MKYGTTFKLLRGVSHTVALLVVVSGCAGTEPIHVASGHTLQPVRAAREVMPCAIQWTGISDLRTSKDPLGYVLAKPVHYPEFFADLEQRLQQLASAKPAEVSASATTLRAELLRAYIEQHSVVISLTMAFRVYGMVDNAPQILSTSVNKTLMIGNVSESRQFIRVAMDLSMSQLKTQLAPVCGTKVT